MPMWLWRKRAHGVIPVTEKGLEAVHGRAAQRGLNLLPASRVTILLSNGGMRGREPAGDSPERWSRKLLKFWNARSPTFETGSCNLLMPRCGTTGG
jgi:hypothetical protein